MNLWTTAEAAEHLRIKKHKIAKRKLMEWGVCPISMGRGRGMGDRWRPAEVEAALDRQQGQGAAPRVQCRSKHSMILGRDMAALIQELTAPQP
jgi:hypothetical protein